MQLAAIDLGSNSFRLEIGHIENDEIVTDVYEKVCVRLAAGLDEHQNLSEAIQQKALETLANFHEKIKHLPATHVAAVGTQTLRVAKNTDAFLEKAQKALGFPIEILRGQEEARLVFKGCAHALASSNANRLIVDIGGASTEVVVGQEFEALCCESFHVGCVNTTLDYFPKATVSVENFQEAFLAAKAEFFEAKTRFKTQGWEMAFGSSGSMEALCSLVNCKAATPETFITRADLETLKNRFIEAGSIYAFDNIVFPDSRKGVLAGGLAVLMAVVDTFEIDRIYFSPGALRRGLMYATLERLQGNDIRHASLLAFLSKTTTDPVRAQRLASFATELLERLNPSVDAETKRLLLWATMAHDVGRAVSPNGFHHHGAYLVRNCHLPGFSRSAQEHISKLIDGHRGKLFKVQEALADPLWAQSLFVLRLTTLMATETELSPAQRLTVNALSARHFVIELTDRRWFDQHPLTFFLLKHEVEHWKALEYIVELTQN